MSHLKQNCSAFIVNVSACFKLLKENTRAEQTFP